MDLGTDIGEIRASFDAGVLRIEMYRPEKKNALYGPMYTRMAELIEEAVAARRLREEIALSDKVAGYIDKGLESNSHVFKATEDPEWLAGQSAGDLAMFIGVTSDKIFRVLEAIEEANAK